MINLLIRVVSWIICLGLLIGGIVLTVTATMENEEFHSDLNDISVTDWIPAPQDNSGNE